MKKVLIVLLMMATAFGAVKTANAAKMGYDNGFFIATDDGNYKFKFNANMQMRYEYRFCEKAGDVNSFVFPRTRLIFTGNVFTQNLTYMFMPEMGDLDQTMNITNRADSVSLYMRDVWFNYKFMDELQIKVGQFFVPRHRQASTISTMQQFGEYPITALSDFSFTWDKGLDIHGSIWKFDYDVVVTNGTGGNLINVGRGVNVGTRIVYNVLGHYGYSESDVKNSKEPNLAVGAHVSYNHNGNFNKVNQVGGATPQYLLASGDVAFKFIGISAEAEFINLHDYAAGTNSPAFTVQAGYFIIPTHLELASQVSYIFWDGADNNEMEVVVGPAYYFKGHKVKVHLTYSLLLDEDGPGAAGTAPFIASADDRWDYRIRVLLGFAF